MLFLSLLMDLFLMFGGAAGDAYVTASQGGTVEQHTIHGHLPAPGDAHGAHGDTLHHGTHGHTAAGSGHEIFH